VREAWEGSSVEGGQLGSPGGLSSRSRERGRSGSRVIGCAQMSARGDRGGRRNSSAAEPRKEDCVGMMISLRLLGGFSGRSHGSATGSEALDVLLFLLSGLEDLVGHRGSVNQAKNGRRSTVGETNLERAQQALVDAHHSTRVVEFTAIVGCAEQSHELALGEELVAVLDNLMCTADQVHVVFLQESRDNVWSKGERHTAVVFAPARDVLVGVGPQKVAEQTAVRDLWKPVSDESVIVG